MVMRVASFVVSALVATVSLLAGLRAAPSATVIAEHHSVSPSEPIVTAGLFDWLFGGSKRDEPPPSGPSD